MKWNPFFAQDPRRNKPKPEPRTNLLVTCLDKRGQRKVVQAYYSGDDDVPFSVKGTVIAWAPMPEPYSGPAEPRQGHLMRETKAAILNTLRASPDGYVVSGYLRRTVMCSVGCSLHTYKIASRDLSQSGEIIKRKMPVYPCSYQWITELPGAGPD